MSVTENERLALIGHKRCGKCHEAKPVGEFRRHGHGKWDSRCKKCRVRELMEKQPELARRRQEREQKRRLALAGKRICVKCGETKKLDAFEKYGERKTVDGQTRFNYSSKCRACLGQDEDRVRRAAENRELAKKGERRCKDCQQIKPTSDFYPRSGGGGFQATCKSCWPQGS